MLKRQFEYLIGTTCERMKDYYQILGILETASQEEIRQAYRRLALVWHPDRHAGESQECIGIAEVNFKEIGEAYRILSDPAKKSDYDWWLRRSRETPPPRPTRSYASTSTAARPSAGRPSSFGRQSSQASGNRNGTGTRADSSYSRARNWGASYPGSHSMNAATREWSFSTRAYFFISDVLQVVWEALFAGVTIISCAIKIIIHRMSRRRKQTCTV